MKAPNFPTFRLRRPIAQDGARSGVGSCALVREDMRSEQIVQRIENLGDPQITDVVYGGNELAPEVAKHVLPFDLAGGDEVELLLEIGGEVVLDIAAEETLEKGRDQAPLVLRHQALLIHPDIFALAEHVKRGGIGRGPADAELLHLFDECRLAVAGRRLGEMLLRLDLAGIERIASGERGKGAVLADGIVDPFFVDLQETVEADDRAGRPHAVIVAVRAGDSDIRSGALDLGARRLACQRPLPDQLIEPGGVVFEITGNRVRGPW